HRGGRDDGEEREPAEQDLHHAPRGQAHAVGEPARFPRVHVIAHVSVLVIARHSLLPFACMVPGPKTSMCAPRWRSTGLVEYGYHIRVLGGVTRWRFAFTSRV